MSTFFHEADNGADRAPAAGSVRWAVIRCCHASESARRSRTIHAPAYSRKVQTLPKWEQVLYTYSSFAQGHDMWQQTETRTGT